MGSSPIVSTPKSAGHAAYPWAARTVVLFREAMRRTSIAQSLEMRSLTGCESVKR